MPTDARGLVRRFGAALNVDDLASALECVTPDVVLWPLNGMLFEHSEYRGHDGIRAWHREYSDPWDQFTLDMFEVRETPAGAVAFTRATARRDGKEFPLEVAFVCEIRDGRIARIEGRDAGEVEQALGGA